MKTAVAQSAIVRRKGLSVKVLELCLALGEYSYLGLAAIIGPGPCNHFCLRFVEIQSE